VEATGNFVESLDLDEVGALEELTLHVVAMALQVHLFLNQAGQETHNLVGKLLVGLEVARESTGGRVVAQVSVGGREDELGEFVEVESLVFIAVVLTHEVVSVSTFGSNGMLVKVSNDCSTVETALLVLVNELEGFHGLEVRVHCEVLTSQFDKRLFRGQVSDQLGEKFVAVGRLCAG